MQRIMAKSLTAGLVGKQARNILGVFVLGAGVVWLSLTGLLALPGQAQNFQPQSATADYGKPQNLQTQLPVIDPRHPQDLIRFHVIANSDSDADQALKRAVRDAILIKVSPQLAASKSLDESRRILQELMPEMEAAGQAVVKQWGQVYPVKAEYGRFIFPTKSYGSLVLPAGEYEAVRVVIGKGEGANWWCVLFPPLCFVDIEHSTAVPVDGKPAVPLQKDAGTVTKATGTGGVADAVSGAQHQTVVKFWLWEKIKSFWH